MSRGKRRMWAGLGLAAVVGAVVYLAAGSLESNVVYFLTPSELEARSAEVEGQSLRLGGMVEAGTVDWNPDGPLLRFRITDGDRTVTVRTTSAPPSMFREEQGVVVEGEYGADSVFRADRLMVKHSNEYEPPDDHGEPAEMYESIGPRSGSGEEAGSPPAPAEPDGGPAGSSSGSP